MSHKVNDVLTITDVTVYNVVKSKKGYKVSEKERVDKMVFKSISLHNKK